MNTISIMTFTVLAFVGSNALAQQKIVRKELYTANIGAQTISTVDVREIVLQPKQIGGVHRHPCPVVSYIVEGAIRFQIKGEQEKILRAGEVCYEPAGAIVEHFDNASDHAPTKFIPYYLLNGQQELIEMLP